MRVERCSRDEQHSTQLRQHASWLLQLGDGKLPSESGGNIRLPDELCVSTVDALVDFVFTDLTVHHYDAVWVSSSLAILCPRNEMVDCMNDRVLGMFHGDTMTYYSADSVAEIDQQSLYPVEYLNSLTLSGLPPHTSNLEQL